MVKAALALCAIAAVGAGLALTGAEATPAGPQLPTTAHLAPVAPKLFQGSVKSLPQLGPQDRHELQKPRSWEREDLVPILAKSPVPGAVQAPAVVTQPAGPAPPPGSGASAGTFAGLDFQSYGAGWPPDTNGDVGPTYYLQGVNTSLGIFRKADGVRVAAFTFDSLWNGAGTGTACDNSNQGDITVNYDPIGDHWFVADFAFTGTGSSPPYYECIAVSRTGDPVNGGWYFYAIRADDAAHPWFPDYPKMGVWPDGLYMSANMYQGASTFREARGWAFNLSDLESGAQVRTVVFDTNNTTYFSMLPSNMRTASGAPPAGSPNYFVSESQSIYGLEVFKFHPDYSGGGSTFIGPTEVAHASYTVEGSTVPSPANPLDTLAERLMNQAQYTNIGGVESIWVNHTVHCCGLTNGPAGIHWLQVNVTGGTVRTTPAQQQIYPGASDGLNRWLGSLAVDSLGDMALGYSVSSSALPPDIRYAGRLAGDPAGTLPQTETTMLPGITRGTQSGSCGGTCTRWGDYSEMTLDPNGCDFWFTTEYYAANGLNWQTRIGSFRLNPNCGSTTRQSQTITFGPLADKTYGDPDFTVSATASSGLPVSFSAAGNCTVSGSTVHLRGEGSCTITASQSGNAQYAPAPDVPQSFTINPGSTTGTPLTLTSTTEGTLSFSQGAWVNGGWHVKLGTANASPVTVQVTGTVDLPVTCTNGAAGGTISVPVSTTVTIPAGSTSYAPTNDQKSVLGWMGAAQAPALCGTGAMRNTSATLNVNVQAGSHTGVLTFQFHYHVPVANRKPNTDCTNPSDPNHNTACAAKWSGAKSI